MDKYSYINYFDYYIPKDEVDVDYVIKNLADDKKKEIKDIDKYILKFKDETKLNKIAYFSDTKSFAGKVYEMIEKMLERTKIDVSKISYILCGHQHLFNMDNISIIHSLKEDFQFTNSMILPIMQPCAATLCGINISNKLLEEDKYILIISGCCWKNIEDRYINFSIRGDGISLVLISQNKGQFRNLKNNVYNYNNSALKINGTLRHDPSVSRVNMISKGSEFLINSLKSFEINIDDVSKIIQPNVRYDVFHDLYSYYTNFNPELFYYDNISNGGHICDIDIVRNLVDYNKKQSLHAGTKIILYTPDVEPTFDINYHCILLEKC